MKKIMLGNEAIAQGAIDAGMSGVYAYPGTPSTEITEYIQRSEEVKRGEIKSSWAVNEKVAFEEALGMSFVGKRAMTAMKHVGLNVAADAFINAAISGVYGGLVTVVADDPSQHSSQNEQDSRFYGKFAMVPILEPSNQQEAYDMMAYAFDLSEKFELPVLFRSVTRISHSRSIVELKGEKRPQNPLRTPEDSKRFVLVPEFAKKGYRKLIEKQKLLEEESETSGWNRFIEGTGTDGKLGIVVSGIAFNYLMENFSGQPLPYDTVKITQYPLPRKMLRKLFERNEKILIIEEGYPFIEEMLSDYLGFSDKVTGKLTGHLPRTGELNPNAVAAALGLEEPVEYRIPEFVSKRPPQLCPGCGHIDMYNEIKSLIPEMGDNHVFSDIGCYSLGVVEPYDAIDTIIDMGASVPMAKGAADAGWRPAIAVIGDSTFTHSGMTGLLGAVWDKSPITVIIADNSAVAMTGAQPSAALGHLYEIAKGLGVEEEHIKVVIPLKKYFDKNVEILKKEIEYQGPSVIIYQRPCVTMSNEMKEIARKFNTLEPSYDK
jgi:indolepyruvate ferredoxin oxidoreductase alpha subunit